jgi:hypothetical protein
MAQGQKQELIQSKTSNSKTAVVACRVLEDEIRSAMEITKRDYPVLYPPKNLHDWPDRLRVEIQSVLDNIENYERVLLCFAFCGNTILGLHSGNFEIIVPRIDDCVSMLFGSIEKRAKEMGKTESVFFTRGMLECEGGFIHQFEYMKKKRGEKYAWNAINLMYKYEEQITVLDDGSYDIEQVVARVKSIATRLNKKNCVKQVSIEKIIELLTGPWNAENYLIVPPNQTITDKMMIFQETENKI